MHNDAISESGVSGIATHDITSPVLPSEKTSCPSNFSLTNDMTALICKVHRSTKDLETAIDDTSDFLNTGTTRCYLQL